MLIEQHLCIIITTTFAILKLLHSALYKNNNHPMHHSFTNQNIPTFTFPSTFANPQNSDLHCMETCNQDARRHSNKYEKKKHN